MAQVDSTPTAVRDLFTGAETERSTDYIGTAEPKPPHDQLRGKAQFVYPRRGSPVRRYFIGGSDVRIIMGNDEAALLRLWREKRGEVEPEDLSSFNSASRLRT